MYLMIFSHIFTITVCVTLNPSEPKINFGQVLNSIENLKTPVNLKYRPFNADMIIANNLFPYVRVSGQLFMFCYKLCSIDFRSCFILLSKIIMIKIYVFLFQLRNMLDSVFENDEAQHSTLLF